MRKYLIALNFVVIGILILAACASTLGSQTTKNESNISAAELKCEYKSNPLGIDASKPRLSWEIQSAKRSQIQTAYRILVANSEKDLQLNSAKCWDSGKQVSKETIHIAYNGKPLKSGQRYFWKVQVWDKAGHASVWSKSSYWEMALLDDGDWEGEWLCDGKPTPTKDEDFYKDDPAPLFRKEFELAKKIKKARLYVTGLGYYEASLNGNKVGKSVLDPGWTNYDKQIFYSTYDVTELVQDGENCLGVTLGNGWYNPLPLQMWGRRNMREPLPIGRPRFISQLNIEFADGSTKSIVSDKDWKVHPGPILRNNVYLGEVYDARKEIENWNLPGLDDRDWKNAVKAAKPKGKLLSQPQQPIRVTKTLKPTKIIGPKPGVYVFDFEQNFAGWVQLSLRASAGAKVTLRFGELLYPDSTLNVMTSVAGQVKGKNDKGENRGGPGSPEIAWQSDTYISKGKGLEVYTPRFTFHGFRYVEVTGLPAKPSLDLLEGHRLNSDINIVGTFHCSNDMINQIQEMTQWTFLSNIFSVQSDCPHREKFGYGGDLATTSEAFMLNFDMAQFYAKAVYDWHDAALPDGMMTDTAPFVGIQYCGVPWAMAHPLLLCQLYQYYGNIQLIEQHYPTASRWLDLVASQNPDFIIREGLSDHEGLEDMPKPQMITPLYYQSAQFLACLAKHLGLNEDVEKYSKLAQNIKQAYLKNFLEENTGKFDPASQASQSFALYNNLVPADEKQDAIDFLLDKIRIEKEEHLSTGMFGTKYMFNVLSQEGYSDAAYSMVNQKTYPGWGYMLENDATTVWEHWAFSDNTYSHNHPMFGSISEWFYKWLAGIQPHPEAVGFDRIIIRPQVIDGLDWVKAEHKSIRGEIVSEWKKENGQFDLKIVVPANTTATVYIPADDPSAVNESGQSAENATGVKFYKYENGAAIYKVGSGLYQFSSK